MRQRLSTGPALRFSQRLDFRLRILALPRRDLRPFFQKYLRGENLSPPKNGGGEEWLAAEPSFRERLVGALSLDLEDSSELVALEELVGNVGSEGYLELAPAEIARRAGIGDAALERVRGQLMAYGERGIGATDFREFFLFQCRGSRESAFTRATALLRSNGNVRGLIPVLRLLRRRLPADSFASIFSQIADGRLRSRPRTEGLWEGSQFSLGAPDLVFFRKDRDWTVRALPEEPEEGCQKFLQVALEMRRTTLLRIGEFLLETQWPFFEEGPLAVRALCQKEIADRLGLSRSTVSRALQGKWTRGPWGLFPLGHFFSRSRESSPLLLGHCFGEIFRTDPATLFLSNRELADLLFRRYGIHLSPRVTCDRLGHLFGKKVRHIGGSADSQSSPC
ncbi:MAG: hypothetical protein LBB14_02745 [Puniceicoccales bacterium]|jgi:DNA-directed RNA polymerase specialized sigma54-like protein|nr:hypothetical protein [Puniceicoccales bacterium]